MVTTTRASSAAGSAATTAATAAAAAAAAAAADPSSESSIVLNQPTIKRMSLFRHAVAYVTLGLLCGWYFFLLGLYPVLIYLAYHGSFVAGTILAVFVTLTLTPLKHEPQEWFMYSWIFGVWREYFGYTFDCESVHHGKLDVKKVPNLTPLCCAVASFSPLVPPSGTCSSNFRTACSLWDSSCRPAWWTTSRPGR